MIENEEKVPKKELVGKVQQLISQGYRFVTISCVELDEKYFDLLYHFDKDLTLITLRVVVERGETVPSITVLLFGAFLIENETQDHFGIVFEDSVLDFGGKLYLGDDVRRTPFCKYGIKDVSKTKQESE